MAVKLPPYHRFEQLPGVGKAVADDLRRMGFVEPAQLRDLDPQQLFEQLEAIDGPTDRCMLYTLRCIVYAVSTPLPDPARLQWWLWSDENLADQSGPPQES